MKSDSIIQSIFLQGEQCYPVPLTQRFTYTKKVADCNQWSDVPSSERWTNDKVVQVRSYMFYCVK